MSRPGLTRGGAIVAFAVFASLLLGGTRDTWATSSCGFSLLSSSAKGAPGNEATVDGSISRNGRYVAFTTDASNIVPHDTNRRYDVFLRDRTTGSVRLAGLGPRGVRPNGAVVDGPLSPDGRYLLIHTWSTNFARGVEHPQSYLRDLSAGGVTLVSVGSDGKPANMSAIGTAMTDAWRFVLFETTATNMPGARGGRNDSFPEVYLRDLRKRRTTLVSVGYDGRPAAFGAFHSSMSADGRLVAFESQGSNLVRGDGNNRPDVFVRDLTRKKTTRISIGPRGGQTPKGVASTRPIMTPSGRFVMFTSDAANLVRGDTNNAKDVFVRDLHKATTTRVSVGAGGAQSDGDSAGMSISDDGRIVTFSSHARNLDRGARGEANGFARDLRTGRTRLVTTCDDGTASDPTVANEDQIEVSGDGRTIILASQAQNFAPQPTDGTYQLYAKPVAF